MPRVKNLRQPQSADLVVADAVKVEDRSLHRLFRRDEPCVKALIVSIGEPKFFEGEVKVGRGKGLAALFVESFTAAARVQHHDWTDGENHERCGYGECNKSEKKPCDEGHAAAVFL
jgi:hypothetical protein